MTTARRHTIGKQHLDVSFNGSEGGAMALQATLSALNSQGIAPAIGRILDRHAADGGVLRIDRLEVDAGAVPLDQLEARLPAMIAEALDKALVEDVQSGAEPSAAGQLDEPVGRRLSEAEAAVDALLFFLRHGTLPAIWRAPSHERFEAQLLEAWQRTDLIRQTAGALAFPPARHRLLAQFSRQVAATLLEKLSPEAMAFIENLLDHFRHSGQTEDATDKIERELLDQALAIAATRPDIAPAELRETLLSAAMSLPEVGKELPRGEIATKATPLASQPASETVSADRDVPKETRGTALQELAAHRDREQTSLMDESNACRADSKGEPENPATSTEEDKAAHSSDQIAKSHDAARKPAPTSRAATDDTTPASQSIDHQRDLPADDSPATAPDSESASVEIKRHGDTPVIPQDSASASGSVKAHMDKRKATATQASRSAHSKSGVTSAEQSEPGTPWIARATETTKPAGEHPDERRGIYVENAGLVLLHPFLPQLFRALAIAGDVELLRPGQALRLLHHLATGFDTAPEYELTLPKILCGLHPASLAGEMMPLSDEEREESAALLSALIRHWEALKNTGIDVLRETFLKRNGKLTRWHDGGWRLQVESTSFDILLDQLPWGISMIRLPWMPEMLRVEWFS